MVFMREVWKKILKIIIAKLGSRDVYPELPILDDEQS